MDDRTMPYATFKCPECLERWSGYLERHHRTVEHESVSPHPKCSEHKSKMTLIQLQTR